MLDYLILDKKPIVKSVKNNEYIQYKDLLTPGYKGNFVPGGRMVFVEKYYVARPDLISLAIYGNDKYADIICKVNGISNPFELNEGMIIYTPDISDIEKMFGYSTPESDILEEELPKDKNKQKKFEEEKISKKIQEYEFGYIIQFLENEESGLIEDFLPKNMDSSDFYNYGLTEEDFKKRIYNSLLYHYENHLKEEKEKRDNLNTFMLNINMNMNNMGNNFIQRGFPSQISQMNNLMMNNMNYNGNNNENNINGINRNYKENKHSMINGNNNK